jgi:hypothetical protein
LKPARRNSLRDPILNKKVTEKGWQSVVQTPIPQKKEKKKEKKNLNTKSRIAKPGMMVHSSQELR